MLSKGAPGLFYFEDAEQNLISRPGRVVASAGGSPEVVTINVDVVAADDDALLEENEQIPVQPTVNGLPVPRILVQRTCEVAESAAVGKFVAS